MTVIPTACITCGRPCPPRRSRCLAHTPQNSNWAKYAAKHPQQAAVYGTEFWRVRRREILERDPECRLRLPGCTGTSTEVDHIVRPSDGGSNDPANLRGVCNGCHRQRTIEQSKEGNRRAAAARRRQR
jgi:5-methylcytosine-specific restriction endonuclease McrA